MTRLASAIRPGLMAAAGLFLALIAQAAEAQNRTNDHLRETIFTSQGFSNAEINRYVRFASGQDTEILPGIYFSRGGFTSSDGSRSQSLDALRLYNESRVTFCVRPEGRLTSGPFLNAQSGGNVGSTFLLTPGSSETVLAHSLRRVVSGGTGNLEMSFYFWLADMNAPSGRRCAALEPPGLQDWVRDPQRSEFEVDLLLSEALGLAPSYQPGVSRAAVQLAQILRRQGVNVDAEGRNVRIGDFLDASNGVIESSAAMAETVDGTRHVLIWVHNAHDRAFCGILGSPQNVGSAAPLPYNLPARGFYLAPGSGRPVLQAARATNQPMPVDLGVRYMFWYPDDGASTDQTCAANVPAGFYEQFDRDMQPGHLAFIGPASSLTLD